MSFKDKDNYYNNKKSKKIKSNNDKTQERDWMKENGLSLAKTIQ